VAAYSRGVFIRRAFFYWQFPAAVILPAWILVGWGIFAATSWQILGLIVGVMLLTVAMLATAGLIFARKDVRADRAVSWLDVGLVVETRRRVRAALANFEAQATRIQSPPKSPRIDGEYIVIETTDRRIPPRI
jgi:hypothetical protein